ncbi:signal transduction protein [Thiolapillus brandeum]|uniref:cyclic-guanylate-specific phosphodiesterase n=2 Tax=Thiolapillus brandeum TaxID=1076588 RepID=A0A7U6JHI1_9GAMM|nr:signal transduction protein [Thiolapillus brandeum]
MISFRLPHYDSLVRTSKKLQELLHQMQRQNTLLNNGYIRKLSSQLERYLTAIERKLHLIERTQSHVAQVRNSLLYLPSLLDEKEDSSLGEDSEKLLYSLVVNTYAHYMFPDKVSAASLEKMLRPLKKQGQTNLRNSSLLRHVGVILDNVEKIHALQRQIASLEIDAKRSRLRDAFIEQREVDDRNALWLGVLLLVTVLLLLAWLWRTLNGLDQARRISERSHSRLQDAVESLGEAFALFNSEHRLVLWNATFETFYPWLKESLKPGARLDDLCKLNCARMSCSTMRGEKIMGQCSLYMDEDDPYYFERLGREKWYLASNRRTKEGGLVCVRTDITESRRAEQELQKLGMALEQSPASVVITDTNGVIEYVNPKFEEVSGYAREEAIGQKPSLLKSGDKTPEEYADMWRTLKAGKEWRGVFHNQRKDGSLYWESARISPVRDEDGQIAYFIGVKEDITQRRNDEEQIRYQANYDLLTGLPNRTLLMDRLRQNVLQGQRGKRPFVVFFIDLDRFKSVNDLYGHAVGDELMKVVGRRLESELRETDTVARFGGDEFVVLLMGVDNADFAAVIARKLIDSLCRPFVLGERKITIGASIGITLFPADVSHETHDRESIVGALLSNADMAMYQAKALGPNRFQFFEQEMQDRVKKHVALEQDLRSALRNGELHVFYQPIIEAYSNEMVGMEALMRWEHPVHGMISPERFIPLAEETGLIGELGAWMFAEACRQVHEWQKRHQVFVSLSVNLSVRQRDKGFGAGMLKQILDESGLDAQYLMLEITENLLLKESDQAIQWLYSLKECGVKLAIDDFGTGYSSLSYLKRFPVDTLKVDRSFIQDLPEGKDDVSLVTAMVAMADSLGIGVVAEGVETEEQRLFLREVGCDYMQGFLFGKPLPAAQMEERLSGSKVAAEPS